MENTKLTNYENGELLGLILAYVISRCLIEDIELVLKLWNQEAKKYNYNILNKRG